MLLRDGELIGVRQSRIDRYESGRSNGIFLASMLEGMAEYDSVGFIVKVLRGILKKCVEMFRTMAEHQPPGITLMRTGTVRLTATGLQSYWKCSSNAIPAGIFRASTEQGRF